MKRLFLVITLIFLFTSCSSELTEQSAKNTIDKIANGSQVGQVLETAGVNNWKSQLKLVNENKRTIEAVINLNRNGKLRYKQNTIFIFNRVNGKWILNGGKENVRLGSGVSDYRNWLSNLYIEVE